MRFCRSRKSVGVFGFYVLLNVYLQFLQAAPGLAWLAVPRAGSSKVMSGRTICPMANINWASGYGLDIVHQATAREILKFVPTNSDVTTNRS